MMFNTTPLQNVRNPWLFCGWMSPSSPSQVLLTLDRCGMASGGKVTCAVEVANVSLPGMMSAIYRCQLH